MSERPKRLLRSRDDRVLAGVAGGIANYFDIDPTLVRVGFVAAVLFGGLGIAAYLVLAVVTPNDDGTGAPARDDRPSPWLVVLAVLAVLILLPGPFWGAFDWWGGGWWWGGSLWLALLIGGAVWLYATLRHRNRRPSGDRGAGQPDHPTPEESRPAPGEATASTERLDATSSEVPPAREGWSRLLRGVAIAVLVLAAASVALAVAAASAWATAVGHGAIVAGVVIALGVALVVAAVIGESRWRWLIAPALVLALPAGAVAAADVSFDGGIGERGYRPATAAELPDDGYSLGVGQMTVDLRGLEWPRGRSVELDTDMGVGQTVVSVPSRVCVEADVNASVGHVLVRGREGSGIDAEVTEGPPPGKAPRVVLDSEVDAGEIVVTDRPPEAFTGDRRDFDGGDWQESDHDADPEEQARQERACAE